MDRQRRRVLRLGGLVLAGGLAGCSGQDGTGTDTDGGATADGGTQTDTPAPTTAETATATDTPPATETATATPQPTLEPSATYALVVDNVDVSAWEVDSDESGSVAPTGTENPTLTFETGVRYEVENRGHEFHPFALRAADDSPLLSQQTDGRFEGDADVNWVDEDSRFAFTMTADLAAAVEYYICAVHILDARGRGDGLTTPLPSLSRL